VLLARDGRFTDWIFRGQFGIADVLGQRNGQMLLKRAELGGRRVGVVDHLSCQRSFGCPGGEEEGDQHTEQDDHSGECQKCSH